MEHIVFVCFFTIGVKLTVIFIILNCLAYYQGILL